MKRTSLLIGLVLLAFFVIFAGCDAETPESLELSGYKSTFTTEESFSTGDIVITAHYANGTSRSIDVSNCIVNSSYFVQGTAGNYLILVTYRGASAFYLVTVATATCTHNYGEWTVTIEATCTEEGSRTRVCSICGNIDTEVVSALGHNYGECTSNDDNTHSKVCTNDAAHTETESCSFVNGICSECGGTERSTAVGLSYTLNSDQTGYLVNGIGSATDSILLIPATYENLPVTGIDNFAFTNCSNLTKVTIPSSVTSIGNSAFSYCTNLESVVIPNAVSSIGEQAFYCCTALKNVTIPSNINAISNSLFYGCNSLTDITIPNKVNSIGHDAFYNCVSLTSITVPANVESIGAYAFLGCYRLVEVYNMSSLKITAGESSQGYVGYYAQNVYSPSSGEGKVTIDDNGFVIYDETALVAYLGADTEITVPSAITAINKFAFYNCNELTGITIQENVTSINTDAFFACTSLISIDVSENNQNYKSVNGNLYSKDATVFVQYALGKTDTSFTIPDSVTSIAAAAFEGCANLTSITIQNGVKSIGSSAFEECSSLASVTIPDSVTSIDSSAFSHCSSLAEVVIPNGVISIGNSAFSNCTSLTSVTISESVTSIGRGAFSDCSQLASVTFLDTSTWYRTTNVTNWTNKTSGTETNLTTVTTNARYLTSTYKDCYWYKL